MSDHAPTNFYPAITTMLREAMAHRLLWRAGIPEIEPETLFADLDCDDLEIQELAMAVGDKWGPCVPAVVYDGWTCLADVARFVEGRVA